ncbi:metallophosphoesterase [Pelagibius litoralis]|uniref:Metallophosphoesterase n=1 Tax=Pelagibius litoralis TaxID=374515 RepID=A0A967EZL6_9PROT|nr:metallophosphoesterase [Pelagibius litoralis]NIA70361.1 metallophosphoesterase [Pelagibius litoralis]
MKICILSDLHLEFADFSPPPIEADVIVLAGDIWLRDLGITWAAESFPPEKTVYVLGNHEPYGADLDESVTRCRETAKQHGVHFLEDEVAVIGGVRFIGATLWSDFRLMGDGMERSYAMDLADRHVNDFRQITVVNDMGQHLGFTARNAVARHIASRQFIERALSLRFPGPTVIVTHFLPSHLSISAKFYNSWFNPYFCSDLTALIRERQPALWIHGHTHESCDYSIGSTRVVCNPRGYLPHDANPSFRPDLTVAL